MSCGCGGECCKQSVAGLGVIPRFPALPPNIRRGRMVRGLGFLYTGDDGNYYIEGGDQEVDWDALWYEATWGIPYDYWNGWDSNIYDTDFLDRQESEKGGAALNNNWQGLLDWWRDFTGGFTGQPTGVIQPPTPSPSTFPDYSGYCPPNHYCVDFPKCTQCAPLNESPAQKAKREAEQKAKAAAQQAAAAAAKAAQQAAQPCPPNTGLVKNPQGRCVCPPGQAFSKTYGKCVLISQLTAEDKKALEGTDWWKYLAIGAFSLIAIKALQGGKSR